MTLGEVTAYLSGTCGRALSSNRLMPLQGRFEKLARRPADVVNKIMLRYGIPTLFVLSVIPNPVFEFAGIAAGDPGCRADSGRQGSGRRRPVAAGTRRVG